MAKSTTDKKITLKISLTGFVKRGLKRTENLIEKTGHETEAFWAGYNQCLQDIKRRFIKKSIQ